MISSKKEFLSKLQEARNLELRKRDIIEDLFGNHSFDDIPFQGEDSDNLEEAIQCYINYGELPLSRDLEEFWDSYSNAVKSFK